MSSIRSICLLLLVVFGINESVFAQAKRVSGIVYEENKNNPLIGATVIMLNANNRVIGGSTTNIDGVFNVVVPEGTVGLTFSFVGLKSQTLPYQEGKKYEIILKGENQMMDQVVITAKKEPKADMGMMTKARKDMSNAVSKVDMEVLETQSVSTVDQLLQGAAPGLQVTFNSGDPGAGASVRIRGTNSLEGNNSPLWVIDGAEVIGEDYNVSDLNNFGSSPIAGIDPSNIESIDILKDASSTAIYGSRGANGVIVIRTKSGVRGKPQISISAKVTSVMKPRRIPLLNGDQQRMFVIEARANKNGGIDNPSTLQELRGDLTRQDAWLYNNNTDMMDLITRTGFQQNYTFSLKGGGERLNYYWSINYDTEYGSIIGGGFNRLGTMVNLNYKVSDKLKVTTKFQYTNTYTDKRSWEWPIYGFNKWADKKLHPQALARERAAFLPVYNQTGTEYYIEDEGGGGHSIPSIGTRMYNPIAMIDNATYDLRENLFLSQLVLDFDINKRLNFNTQVSIDYREGGNEFFAPSEALGVKGHHNRFNAGVRDNSYNMLLMNKNRLFYRPLTLENHYLGITAIADVMYRTTGSTSMNYNRSGSSGLMESGSAAVIENAGGSQGENTSVSFVMDIHYRLMNRYNFSVSLKTEGSSTYGKDNPFAIYPTAGFAWRMEEEAFLKDKEWITSLKPRFSYGQTGKLPNVTNMLSVAYGNSSNGYMGDPYTYISKFAYDNIHEERTTEYNYGLDWDLFKGRLSGEFNYFTRTTNDLLMTEPMSSSTGFGSRYTNFGTLRNRGIELGITMVPVKYKDFNWRLYVSGTRDRQKLMTMPEQLVGDGYTENLGYGGFRTKLEEGSVIGGFYGLRAKGVYSRDEEAVVRDFNGHVVYDSEGNAKKLRWSSSTGPEFKGGDMIYEDINHDGVINDLDIVQIGDCNVGMYGMIRNNFDYKGFSLLVSFYYSLEQDVINGLRYGLESMTSETNQATSILRRWRKQGDVTDMPRAEDYCERNYAASSRWVEDASFIKLKEVSLTYNVPARFAKKLYMSQLSAWVSAMDLACWSKYKGINPEIGLNTGTLAKIAVDKANTAPSTKVSIGLRATF